MAIKITNKFNGKVYELVPENKLKPCEGCAFDMDNGNVACSLKQKDNSFNGLCVCTGLRGIWKEVKSESQKSTNESQIDERN